MTHHFDKKDASVNILGRMLQLVGNVFLYKTNSINICRTHFLRHRMTSAKTNGESKHYTSLVDLHEHIFHEIFRCLADNELYFSMMNTCKKIEGYVINYMGLSGIFMSVGGGVMNPQCLHDSINDCINKRPPSQIIYAFKRNEIVVSIRTEDEPKLPVMIEKFATDEKTDFQRETKREIASFGGVIKGRIIAGYYCLEYYEYDLNYFNVSSQGYMHQGYMLNPYLFEFDPFKKIWRHIVNRDSEPLHYTYYVTCDLSFCVKGDSIVVGLAVTGDFFGSRHYTELVTDYKVVMFQFEDTSSSNGNEENPFRSNLKFSSKVIEFEITKKSTEFAIMTKNNQENSSFDNDSLITGSSMIHVEPNKLYLFGASRSGDQKTPILWKDKDRDVEGGFDIELIKIHLEPILEFWRCMCFKLKDNAYIIGNSPACGKLCDIYNLIDEKYYGSYDLVPTSVRSIHSVVTDAEETFAVILSDEKLTSCCDRKPRIMIFTEKDGFQKYLQDTDLTIDDIKMQSDSDISGAALLRIK